MKKLILSALFLSAIGSANATTTIRVICCDGSVHDFYGVSQDSYSLVYGGRDDYDFYLKEAAKKYCREGCIRSVFELIGSTLSLSAEVDVNEQEKLVRDEKLVATVEHKKKMAENE